MHFHRTKPSDSVNRWIDATSTDEPVVGTFEVQDRLEIETDSAPVNITITLHTYNMFYDELPAELRIKSVSGSVTVSVLPACLEPGNLSTRRLKTEIETESGVIKATLPHWGKTILRSSTGDITANIYPHSQSESFNKIKLTSNGKKDMTVFPHVFDPEELLSTITISCKGKGRNTRLICPLTWLGNFCVYTDKDEPKIDWPGKAIRDGFISKRRKIEGSVAGRSAVGRYRDEFHTNIKIGSVMHGDEDVEVIGKDFRPGRSTGQLFEGVKDMEQEQAPKYEKTVGG